MERAKARRRRLALVVLAVLAIVAFALGARLGDSDPPGPTTAERLSLQQLAGQRLIAGFGGTAVPPRLRAPIRQGRLAGVVLFADNFPSRAAGRRLTARLQSIRR